MTRQTQADLWQDFIADRLNNIAQTFNEERYHELLIKQQNERINVFTGTLNEAQQIQFTELSEAATWIAAEKEEALYCAGLLDGIRLMATL